MHKLFWGMAQWIFGGPISLITPNILQQKHKIQSSKKNAYNSITFELCEIEQTATYHLIVYCLTSLANGGTALCWGTVNDFKKY